MAKAYAFVLQNRDTPAPDVVELTSPFAAANTPKTGLTLSDKADGPFLMGLFSAANKNNQLLQIVTVSLPLLQDKDPAVKPESLGSVEYLKLSHLTAGARADLIDLLVGHYESKFETARDSGIIMQLTNATSNSKFTSLCALEPSIVDAIAEVLPNIGAVSHPVLGNNDAQKINEGLTVFRGGDHPNVVFSVKAPLQTISGNRYSEFRFPAISCKPLLSQSPSSKSDTAPSTDYHRTV